MFDAPLEAFFSLEATEAAAAELWDAAPRFDAWDADLQAMMRPVRDRGLFVACLPPAEGGSGLATDPARAADLEAVLRRIGGASLPAGRLFEGHVNAVKLVFLYGSAAASAGFARDVRGGAVSGVWNAEAPPGLAIVERDERRVLQGAKIYCSGAGWLERPLVTARSAAGPVITAPRDASAMRVDLGAWRASGMRATATGSVTFDGLVLEDVEVVGAPGDYLRSPAFKAGAWRFCAVQVGGAERLLSLMARHLEDRGRGADPHQRARIGQATIAVETARLWVSSARSAAETAANAAAADAYVNLARTAVEAACADLLRLVDRSVGLEAKMVGSPIERVARDLAVYLRQPFPDAALDDAAQARVQFAAQSPHAAGWT